MISLSSIVKANSFHICPVNDNDSFVQPQSRTTPFVKPEKSSELILEQAVKKSKHIHEEAMKRANDVMDAARAESLFIRTKAEQQGYMEGYSRGLQDGANESRKAAEEGLREIEALIAAIRNERAEAIERQQKELLSIAFELAKKIMKQQLLTDENAILKMLEEAIPGNETGVRIFLPEYSRTLDVAIDKSIAEKIQNTFPKAKVIITQSDDLIAVETENGMVDMSIPVQLSQLREAINL